MGGNHGGRVQLNVLIDYSQREELLRIAEERKRSVGSIVREMLDIAIPAMSIDVPGKAAGKPVETRADGHGRIDGVGLD